MASCRPFPFLLEVGALPREALAVSRCWASSGLRRWAWRQVGPAARSCRRAARMPDEHAVSGGLDQTVTVAVQGGPFCGTISIRRPTKSGGSASVPV